ncbi:flagellar motor protein MotB [Thermicanus aegyptius]|uniref:flagellar motor protein MotB n=1 Tax=Thermicanus aegyptius TaxID=94009 RepID=UPI00042446A3|nr:flagellar motor protein MotB [Thermicanus aegyptius]
MWKNKRSHGEEHQMDETWLIPYADLLTLLLALFIVLFSLSEIDSQKVEKMANAFNIAFRGAVGVLQYDQMIPTKVPNLTSNPAGSGSQNNFDQKEIERLQAYQQETAQLKKIMEEMNQYIEKNGLTNQLKTSLTNEGLLLTIGEDALFDSGKADILPQARKIAKEISVILEKSFPHEVSVSGHTDNRPIHNAEFQSNWDLSTARAVNFLNVILENKNLSPDKFRVIGYGEYRPVADNNTERGRALNRRVEVLIARMYK